MPHPISRWLICTTAAVVLSGGSGPLGGVPQAARAIFFGVFVRGVLVDRLERQAPFIVRGLRARLESGNPPDEGSDLFSDTHPGVH